MGIGAPCQYALAGLHTILLGGSCGVDCGTGPLCDPLLGHDNGNFLGFSVRGANDTSAPSLCSLTSLPLHLE
jgi:hypothetical protein